MPKGMLKLFGFKGRAKLRDLKEARGAQPGMPMLHYVYENKRQPDGWGANRYAFETLQPVPYSPIDRAVRVRRQILYPFEGPQLWAGLAVKISPIPSMAGGIFTGGMVQSDGTLPQLGTDSAIDMLAVSHNDPSSPVGANDPSPVYGPNDPMGEWT